MRTPGLVTAMESDGWQVRWVRAPEADTRDPIPDLLLLAAPAPGPEDYALARALRERKPGLPVLVLAESATGGSGGTPGISVQGFLARTQPDQDFAASLRRFRPDSARLTSEDLFGDLLQELEAPPRPAPSRPLKAAAPPSLTAEEIFGDVLQQVEALVPEVPSRPPVAAPPPGPTDFTLSGISGVHDPFGRPAVPEVPEPPAAGPPSPQAPSGLLPEGRVLEEYGNYYLLEKIAVGGMAELFKAQQRGVQGFQKIVAIKRILPHFSDNEDVVTMFIDEAKLAAQLTHPNIAQIFDLGKAGNSYYIAMEYVNGRDLRTLLKRAREFGIPFPEQVAAFVAMKVAAALDYAHRKRGFDDRELKLVHRDISPQNILLSTEGAVKLVDFGIAKAASKASHTVAGALKGKLLYMSPEQATGQPLDNRSDLYSLGLVLFELITGERCFQADSELGVLEKVRLGRVADLQALKPSVSKEMAAIVSRALQKNVEHRYPSARFMERDLRDFLQHQGTPITEHDVAEYVEALLAGPMERLEALVSARFPQSAGRTSGTYPLPAAPAGETATRVRPRTLPGLPPSPGLQVEGGSRLRPRWLLPLILLLAALLAVLLWAVAAR